MDAEYQSNAAERKAILKEQYGIVEEQEEIKHELPSIKRTESDGSRNISQIMSTIKRS